MTLTSKLYILASRLLLNIIKSVITRCITG